MPKNQYNGLTNQPTNQHLICFNYFKVTQGGSSIAGPQTGAAHTPETGSQGNLGNRVNRGSIISTASSASKPSSAFVSIHGLIADSVSVKENPTQKVQVIHALPWYD